MTSLTFGPVVFGGNVFGWTVGRDDAYAVLDAFLDGGGRSIDSADSYTQFVPGNVGGESEAQIGDWMAERGCRDRLEIHTKVSSKRDRPGLSARNIVLAAEDSLRRLRTDHIDLYYAHRDDPEVPQEEYVVAFDSLVRPGRSARSARPTSAPLGCAVLSTSPPTRACTGFTVAQDRWSLVERGIEGELLPTLADRGWSSSRMRRWPPGSSPASTGLVRPSTRPAPRPPVATSTTRAARGCCRRSTRWPRRTTRRSPRSRSRGCARSRRSARRSPAPGRRSRWPPCSRADLQLSADELDRLTAASQPFAE